METAIIGKVTRLGNSLAIVIPAPVLRAFKIQRGQRVLFLALGEEAFTIKPISERELRELKGGTIE